MSMNFAAMVESRGGLDETDAGYERHDDASLWRREITGNDHANTERM